MNPPGVLRQVATYGGDKLAGGVGDVQVALVGYLLGNVEVYYARLDDDPLVRDIYLQNPTHPGEHDEHPRLDRQGPAREPGPRASRYERYSLLVTEPDDLLDLLGALGQNDQVRADPVVHKSIALTSCSRSINSSLGDPNPLRLPCAVPLLL